MNPLLSEIESFLGCIFVGPSLLVSRRPILIMVGEQKRREERRR